MMSDPRQMGRKKKDVDTINIRIERDAYELARQVTKATGESIVTAASRLIRENAKAEIRATVTQMLEKLDEEPKPKVRAKRKGG